MLLLYPRSTGDRGEQGERGERGSQDEQGPILQPSINSNILTTEIVNPNTSVTFPSPNNTPNITVNGFIYNGTDTFTIVTPGLYSLTCVLSLVTNNVGDNVFSIEVNGVLSARQPI